MKLAPLVFWQAARSTARAQALRECDTLTAFAHASVIAQVCI